MRSVVLVALLAVSCFREAYPCDDETASVMIASCRAKYAACEFEGHAADCPATDECRKMALERQAHCAKQIQEDQ